MRTPSDIFANQTTLAGLRISSPDGTVEKTTVTLGDVPVPMIEALTLTCAVGGGWQADVRIIRTSLDVEASTDAKLLCLQLLQLLPVSVRKDLLLEVIPSDVPPGHARFDGLNGWPGEAEEAATILTRGQIYKVIGGSVSRDSTSLELEGVPGNFNSVMFEVNTSTCPVRSGIRTTTAHE